MELKLFIDRVLTENNRPCTTKDVEEVEKYIYERAKKEAGNNKSIGIDDETIKKWILEYDFSKSEEEPKEEAKEEAKEETKPVYKPIEVKPRKVKEEKSEWSWGKQESLF